MIREKILKYAIVFLLINILFELQGQPYKSVLQNSTFVQFTNTGIWVDKKNNTKVGDDPYYLGTAQNKDSVCFQNIVYYNDTQYYRYKSLLTTENTALFAYPLEDVYLRENKDCSKLFSRQWLDKFDKEFLVYDISLQKGDTFPTVINILFTDGIGYNVAWMDTNLVVKDVYYDEGRKVVEFDYFQQLGPYSQTFKFIEGIGPNYGIYPLSAADGYYLWAALVGAYNHEIKTYGFESGVIKIPDSAQFYYSLFKNTGWGHYMVRGDVSQLGTVEDPYLTEMEQGYDSLQLISFATHENYNEARLQSSFSGNYFYLYQTSNCTQIFSSDQQQDTISGNLIYDISLNIRDTFKTNLCAKLPLGQWAWVDTLLIVDTVYYDKGRKVVSFDYWHQLGPYSHKLSFIEGIGPSVGLFPLSKFDENIFGRLTSVFSNNSNIYTYTPFVSIKNVTNKKKNISIYPNPASEYIYINGFNPDEELLIKVFDFQGNLLIQNTTTFNKIEIVNLIPGIYYINIFSSDVQAFSFKLIKL